jgi:rsbT co-antagonist protein RsbR
VDDILVRERITDILVVLSAIGAGSLDERLATGLPDDDPFSTLYEGINDVVERLITSNGRLATYQHELESRLQTIEQQRNAIRELSTPVIEVWDGVLCLPIVGIMDTARSVEMTERILHAVMEERARCVIIDVTGIGVMDTRTVDQLIRLAKAVRLLDAQCFLTGIGPVIAQTLDQMGVDLSTIATRRTLRDALQEYVRARLAARSGRAALQPPSAARNGE